MARRTRDGVRNAPSMSLQSTDERSGYRVSFRSRLPPTFSFTCPIQSRLMPTVRFIFRAMLTRRELLATLAITGLAPLSRIGGFGIMKEMGDIKVLFVAGFGPIVSDTATSRKLY